ncbi:MAG: hypothetical protein HQL15_01490 [Candidatus Omnitrophica bacterium]|nr:hypothetical protein [Candidatus Omnitrophota bacterium]
MKTVLMKIFLMFAAAICMFEGLVFLSVGVGKLSPSKLVTLYNQLLSMPAAFKTIQIVGGFFILLGFILLLLAARTKPVPKTMSIEQDGKSLNIAYRTLIDFVEQVGSQNPYVTHFRADFINDHKEGLVIPVSIQLNGVPSVHHVLSDIEKRLRIEIQNVFALNKFKFDFNVQEVSIDPKKKYFVSNEVKETAAPVVTTQAVVPEPVLQEVGVHTIEQPVLTQATNHNVSEDLAVEEDFTAQRSDDEIEKLLEVNHPIAKKSTLLSRMLWGK